jgi:hypothetical protein
VSLYSKQLKEFARRQFDPQDREVLVMLLAEQVVRDDQLAHRNRNLRGVRHLVKRKSLL